MTQVYNECLTFVQGGMSDKDKNDYIAKDLVEKVTNIVGGIFRLDTHLADYDINPNRVSGKHNIDSARRDIENGFDYLKTLENENLFEQLQIAYKRTDDRKLTTEDRNTLRELCFGGKE